MIAENNNNFALIPNLVIENSASSWYSYLPLILKPAVNLNGHGGALTPS